MSVYRLVSETELDELLYSYHKLAALENGGVDNWMGYGDAIHDYILSYHTENNILLDEWLFDGIVNKEIQEYPIYEG